MEKRPDWGYTTRADMAGFGSIGLKARFHKLTKHADKSTLVGLEANNQKFGLCHRLVRRPTNILSSFH